MIGGGWRIVVHHLGVLEENGLVSSLIDGRHKRFFPIDSVDGAKRGQIAALRSERTGTLYDPIAKEPGVGPSQLAARGGIRLAAAQWHLGRLERAQLVGRERRGRRVRHFALSRGQSGPSVEVG